MCRAYAGFVVIHPVEIKDIKIRLIFRFAGYIHKYSLCFRVNIYGATFYSCRKPSRCNPLLEWDWYEASIEGRFNFTKGPCNAFRSTFIPFGSRSFFLLRAWLYLFTWVVFLHHYLGAHLLVNLINKHRVVVIHKICYNFLYDIHPTSIRIVKLVVKMELLIPLCL